MTPYVNMTPEERRAEYAAVCEKYEKYCALSLDLNMARGKPGNEQLALVSDLLAVLIDYDDYVIDGIDARNYGGLTGLPPAKRLFAELLGTKPEEVFVAGNASLQLMYDLISKAHTHGLLHSERPWCKEDKVKFLCPAPGYDRHFKICESFGMEMITIAMTPNGPDMDAVEEAVRDPGVKGIWCVPKYSNPDGIIYSDEVIDRLASLKPAAPDFTIMWDNAYCVHEFDGEFVPFRDIISVCREHGNADMVYEFASTSKITYPGGGVGVMASSVANQKYISALISIQTIGFDKINHLRHVQFLKDKANTLALMKRHADILKPKFDAVLQSLKNEIEPLKIAQWTKPKGGYFVSVNAMPGTAKRIVSLMKQAGVVLTDAGATFPYGIDPNDSNIRIAPTLPSPEELAKAMEGFCICLRMAALERLEAQVAVPI